ncbi:MAG TPA: (Fe-S)-binding protein, partial [Candidatus Lokiarchaeia archaeon]|nr:(Fe-S)-binding protein [Candidatus Lokiarchaeia archaeon]
MATLKRTEEMRDRIYSCVGVGDCRAACKGPYSNPIAEATCPFLRHGHRFESTLPRGHFSTARALLTDRIEPSEGLAETFYQCTLCGGCREVCNNCENADWAIPAREGIGDHTEIWEGIRADLVDAGVAPMPRHKEILESVTNNNNPYFEEGTSRLAWVPLEFPLVPDNPDAAFFVGCTGAYRLAESPTNFLRIASQGNFKVAMTPDESCCGSVALRCGAEEVGRKMAEHNAEVFKALGVSKIVTNCAGCYRTLKIDYPKLLDDWDFEVVHSLEVVDELLKSGALQVSQKIDGDITYHDPCHLGRHCGIYDAPRNIINAIRGGNFVEMRRHRNYAYCCGAGGGVKSG